MQPCSKPPSCCQQRHAVSENAAAAAAAANASGPTAHTASPAQTNYCCCSSCRLYKWFPPKCYEPLNPKRLRKALTAAAVPPDAIGLPAHDSQQQLLPLLLLLLVSKAAANPRGTHCHPAQTNYYCCCCSSCRSCLSPMKPSNQSASEQP